MVAQLPSLADGVTEWGSFSSIAAVLVAIASLTVAVFAQRNARRAAERAIRPVLVFVYHSSEGWTLENRGNGPAINVMFAHRGKKGGDWAGYTALPPLGSGGKLVIDWARHDTAHEFCVCYEDVEARGYSTEIERKRIRLRKLSDVQPPFMLDVAWEASTSSFDREESNKIRE